MNISVKIKNLDEKNERYDLSLKRIKKALQVLLTKKIYDTSSRK